MERVDSYGFDFGVLTRATNIAADYTQSTIDLPTAREQMDNIATTGKSWSKKGHHHRHCRSRCRRTPGVRR